jgi:iron complex outermembrane receptor protein
MNRRPSALAVRAALACLTLSPAIAAAQLEEIVVTAQRRETNLQQTPISIAAFSGEALHLSGIEQGRDLGIMVPNVVLNPAGGGGPGGGSFYIRGLPGVGVYVDGVWQGDAGLLESNFVETERVEVLRGPQGTLFGRNTNGGAINITTRKPGDTFGARIGLELGEYNRRDATLAVDVPLAEHLKTKWMGSSLYNDGFLKSLTTPRSFGGQDDRLYRGDILWEPTDKFTMRVTLNDETKHSSDARIVRFTNTQNVRYLAYNVLAGNPDFLAAARAINPAFPDPPKQLAARAFTPLTHQPGYPGGQVGKWETKSNTPEGGTARDLDYQTVTMDWRVTDHFALQSITAQWKQNQRQVTDFDGSEFTITTDDFRTRQENFTEELHFTGDNFKGRLHWLAGLYYLDQTNHQRYYRWGMYEFQIPNIGPGQPAVDTVARDYVRAYGTVVNNAALRTFSPIPAINADQLTGLESTDDAFFGEVTVTATPKLNLTFGVRLTGHDGRAITYTPVDAFRTMSDQISPSGNYFAGPIATVTEDPDLGDITTNKFAASYQLQDDMMLYVSWGEGFTSGGVTISPNFPNPIILDPEIISTTEVGVRSDWLDKRLRFNASYFQSDWKGLRVPILPDDPNFPPNTGHKLPFPVTTSQGVAKADGYEFELVWAPNQHWLVNGGVGVLDSRYVDIGDPDPSGINGIQPGLPFAYAPKLSATLSLQYDQTLRNGGHMLYIGNYGWKDKYVRDPSNQRIPRDANGNIVFEPAYGLFNARVRYEPPEAKWNVELWGRNLGDVQYVNGGFDTRTVWGYDFTVVGPAREVGASLTVRF